MSKIYKSSILTDTPTPQVERTPDPEETQKLSLFYGDKAQESKATDQRQTEMLQKGKREKDPAAMFYGESTLAESGPYQTSIRDGVNKLRDRFGISDDDTAKASRAAAEMFNKLEITPHETRRMYGLYSQYLIEPADEKTVRDWSAETREEIRVKYGKDADKMVQVAKAFVSSQPGLQQALDHSGLGSHPEFSMQLIEAAWQSKLRNK